MGIAVDRDSLLSLHKCLAADCRNNLCRGSVHHSSLNVCEIFRCRHGSHRGDGPHVVQRIHRL